MLIPPREEVAFLAFSDLLTGYRLSAALMLAHDAGLFEAVGREGCAGKELCARVGWEPVAGERFLRCLCSLGLLRREGDNYGLSRFAEQFLFSGSSQYQGQTLAFEQQLQQSWQQLAATLKTGQRVFAIRDKSPEELQAAFSLYLDAMDEAACIRAEELWESVPVTATAGTLLDIGAGSGAFLSAFLGRYPNWQAIFCDLPDVVNSSNTHRRLAGLTARLTWCSCNLLAEGSSDFDGIGERSCDLVLLSNVIHCQGTAETGLILRKATAKIANGGRMVIHDFFSDTGWRGALYDLHMMLNTYNGRTYTRKEVAAMAASWGFPHSVCWQLPSGSTAMVFTREKGQESVRTG